VQKNLNSSTPGTGPWIAIARTNSVSAVAGLSRP
jgi:hypothetical protein